MTERGSESGSLRSSLESDWAIGSESSGKVSLGDLEGSDDKDLERKSEGTVKRFLVCECAMWETGLEVGSDGSGRRGWIREKELNDEEGEQKDRSKSLRSCRD